MGWPRGRPGSHPLAGFFTTLTESGAKELGLPGLFEFSESPRVTHAAAGPGELGGCSAVPKKALAQFVLRDDVLHPGDVQQGQQHPQELPREGQPQSAQLYLTLESCHSKVRTQKTTPRQNLQHITAMLLNYLSLSIKLGKKIMIAVK